MAGLDGGLRAHHLTDGLRLPERDLALEASAAPVGLWSDGATVWVAEWLGDTVHAYRLADGRRPNARTPAEGRSGIAIVLPQLGAHAR